jgi:hypothetical protein
MKTTVPAAFDPSVPVAEGRDATARRLRRFRRVRQQLLTDRGGDPTEAQQILADNAAALAMRCEEAITHSIHGTAVVDIGAFNSMVNTLRRLLESLGIDRVPRDITTLAEYMVKRNQQQTGINGRANEHN